MGFYVSSMLVSVVDESSHETWLKSNLNKGKLDHFYWLLAGLVALDFMLFLFFAIKHQYKVQPQIVNQVENGDEKELQAWEKGNGVA